MPRTATARCGTEAEGAHVMRIVGRLGALLLGILGVIVGFFVNLIGVVNGHMNQLTTHGFLGTVLVIVGLIGAVLAPVSPIVAAVLMLIAGIGFFFVVGPLAALLVAVPFVLGAILAYMDRRPAHVERPI